MNRPEQDGVGGRRRRSSDVCFARVRSSSATAPCSHGFPRTIAFLIGVAALCAIGTAKPGAIVVDKKTLHELCYQIQVVEATPSDSDYIMNNINVLFPTFAATFSDAHVTADLFLRQRPPVADNPGESSRNTWPFFGAKRAAANDRHPTVDKRKSLSADQERTMRVGFVHHLIETDYGDGVKAAFAAVLMCMMPSDELSAYSSEPHTLFQMLVESALSRQATPWPLLALCRKVAGRMSSEALAVGQHGALYLVYEEGFRPLFEQEAFAMTSPSTSPSDLALLFHYLCRQSPYDLIMDMASDFARQFPAQGALWARAFIGFLQSELLSTIRAWPSSSRPYTPATFGRPELGDDPDLLMQIMLYNCHCENKYKTPSFGAAELVAIILNCCINETKLDPIHEYRYDQYGQKIPFNTVDTFLIDRLKATNANTLVTLALRHCYLNGIVDEFWNLLLSNLPKASLSKAAKIYTQLINDDDFPMRLSDPSHFLRIMCYGPIAADRNPSPTSGLSPEEKYARVLQLAMDEAERRPRLSRVVVQVLFQSTLTDPFCAKVIGNPLWSPSVANLDRLGQALVAQPILRHAIPDLVPGLLRRPDVLAQVAAMPAPTGLARALQRLQSGASLADWLTELRAAKADLSAAQLCELYLEAAAVSEPHPVCRHLIEALIDRQSGAPSAELRLVVMALYLRVPPADLHGLGSVLPLSPSDWADLIGDSRWRPSLEHLSDLSDLVACCSAPDAAFRRMLMLLLQIRAESRVDLISADPRPDAIWYQLLPSLMAYAEGVNFALLAQHSGWPLSLLTHVIGDLRWAPIDANVDAIRATVSRDDSESSVCGDLLWQLLNRDGVRQRLGTVHPGPEPLRRLLLWLYVRAPQPTRTSLKAHSFWNPSRDWALLAHDRSWTPTRSTLAVLQSELKAGRVSQCGGAFVRQLRQRTEIGAVLDQDGDVARGLRAVLLALPSCDERPNWRPLYGVKFWRPNEWVMLLGKSTWTPLPDHLNALRSSISTIDEDWADVVTVILNKAPVQSLLNASSSPASDQVRELIAHLMAHIPPTHADEVRAKFPDYRQWLSLASNQTEDGGESAPDSSHVDEH